VYQYLKNKENNRKIEINNNSFIKLIYIIKITTNIDDIINLVADAKQTKNTKTKC
jgi:hypothetical protein